MRRTIVYTLKRRATADFAVIEDADKHYMQGVILAFFAKIESNTEFLTSLLQPAHLGKTKDNGKERDKHWLDFLSGMLRKSAAVLYQGEDFTVQQFQYINRLLAHVGEQKINFLESDEELFQFGKAA